MEGRYLVKKQQEDHSSFENLFKLYYPFAVRQVLKIISTQAIAEEIAQEVFLQLYHIDRTTIQNIPAWLAKSCFHATCNYIRGEKRHQARVEKEAAERIQTAPSTEQEWLKQEEIRSIRHLLLQLDELDRDLLLMKFSGFSYTEIAEATQVRKEHLGTLLFRAKKKFQHIYLQQKEGVE